MDNTQITLAVLLVLAVGYALWGYPRKYGALSGRSRLYRTTGIGIIILLLTFWLIGVSTDFYAGDVDRRVAGLRQLAHWSAVLLMALSLPFIALLDALETYVVGRREKRAFLEQMIREEVEKAQARAAEKKAAQTGQAATVSNGGQAAIQQVGGSEQRGG